MVERSRQRFDRAFEVFPVHQVHEFECIRTQPKQESVVAGDALAINLGQRAKPFDPGEGRGFAGGQSAHEHHS